MLIYGLWPMVLSILTMAISSEVVAYLDPDSGFLMLSIIFWTILLFVYLVELFVTLCLGCVSATLSTLYLKYRFQEINEKIDLSLKLKSPVLLMIAITEHNINSKQTKNLNQFFGLIVFILYFMVTPPLMLLLYLIHAEDTYYYTRFVAAAVFILVFLGVF